MEAMTMQEMKDAGYRVREMTTVKGRIRCNVTKAGKPRTITLLQAFVFAVEGNEEVEIEAGFVTTLAPHHRDAVAWIKERAKQQGFRFLSAGREEVEA